MTLIAVNDRYRDGRTTAKPLGKYWLSGEDDIPHADNTTDSVDGAAFNHGESDAEDNRTDHGALSLDPDLLL